MSRDERFGLAGFVVGSLGVGITILWPQARLLGWAFIILGVWGVWYWGRVEFKEYVEKRAQEKAQEALNNVPTPCAEPNLVFKTPAIVGGLTHEGTIWVRGYSNTMRYEAWIVPIKNEAIPGGKEVGKAERITAEIVLSSGGTTLLEVSPAFWIGQTSTKIDIESPNTKELVVAFKESISGYGYWEMGNFHGIPLGCRSGELKIRLLRERDSGTSYLATKFYKWKRAPELGDFGIEEVR